MLRLSRHQQLHLWRFLALILAFLLAACDTTTAPSPRTSTGAPTASAALASPQPTALPSSDLLARGLESRQLGDYDAAATDFHTLLTAHPDAPEARSASFYLAETFVSRRRWSSAADSLRAFLASGPQDDLHARALFLLARSQEEAGAHADAIATYQRYRLLKTVLEPYARMREAAQQRALDQPAQAAEGYEAAAGSDIVRGERAGAYEKAIALRRQLGQNDVALGLYRALLELADSPDYSARILGEAADLAEQTGASDQAAAWRREIVERAPESPQALDAVAKLVSDPRAQLAPASAARVYSAHEQWDAALPQFDAAIAAASGEPALELRRQRALARRAGDDFAGALADLAAIGAESPSSEPGRQAQLDWVQTKGQSGDTAGAIEGYREFALAYPSDPRAPEALSRAATLLGRLGDAEAAAQQQLDLGRRYPAAEQAHDALYEAGWYLFHSGRVADAQAAWTALSQNSDGIVAAQSAFWAARAAQQLSQDDARRTLFERAIAAAPDSYYAARAADLLGQAAAGSAPIGTRATDDSWRAAEDWIASWSGAPAYHVAESGYPADVAQFGSVLRAIALEDVGLQSESIAEWNQAREVWHDDAVKLYLLARLASEHGVPYIGLKAAEDLVKRAPNKSYAVAPQAIQQLIFPTPYSAAIIAQARAHHLDPRALYAMLRQESLFNPGATSWVGARGLAQIMPTTAEGIAQNLGVDSFEDADLYRPVVSISFGAFYLGRQIETMDGSLQAALAAYNGGPGNAQRWAGGTTVADPDLFTEGIDYNETRGYVKLVYGYYGAYQRLYQSN